jgi:hypothetical protein
MAEPREGTSSMKIHSRFLLGAFVITIAFGVASAASALTETFTNPDTITVPTAGQGSPYPSTINVAGIVETVVDVNVTLNDLSHTYASDLYFVLEGPTGQALVLMNDAGGGNSFFASVVFDDEAAGPIPYTSAPSTGTSYQVSQYDSVPGGADTAPAPNPGLGGNLALFDGLEPLCLRRLVRRSRLRSRRLDAHLRDSADSGAHGCGVVRSGDLRGRRHAAPASSLATRFHRAMHPVQYFLEPLVHSDTRGSLFLITALTEKAEALPADPA